MAGRYKIVAGRPRALDLEVALPIILRLFWEHGYSGQTLDQIATELGVAKPTLYRTLGDKEAVFISALQEYYDAYIAPAEVQLQQAETLQDGLRSFYHVFIARIADETLPPGCFMGDSATSVTTYGASIGETLQSLHTRLGAAVQQRVVAAIADGELQSTTEAVTVVQFILGQISALAAISRSAPTARQLATVVEYSIAGLPWAHQSATT